MKRKHGFTRRELLALGASLPLGVVVGADSARAAETCGLTPRQTSGPFFPAFEQVDKDVDLTRVVGHDGRAEGEVIRVRGRVLDEQCRPVEGALVDLWQANAKGRYSHPADRNPAPLDPSFQGWGQAVTDAEGRYAFTTIKPAPYPLEFVGGEADTRAGYRTPHLHFRVAKRGHRELTTQMYFAGEPLNERDAVLARVPASERPRVVIAPQRGAGAESPLFVFDVVIAHG